MEEMFPVVLDSHMIDPITTQEQLIAEKIAEAKKALADKRRVEREAQRHKERTQKIQQYCELVRQRLQPLKDQLAHSLAECVPLGEEHPVYLDLKSQLEQIDEQMANPLELAEQLYEEEIERERIQEQQKEWEEQVLAEEQRIENEINLWRKDLLQDLLHTIDTAENYFEASDIAIYIRDFKEDLIAIDALEAVLEYLIERLNELNTKDTVLELRQPIEGTLDRMVDFALKQRVQQSNFFKTNNGPPSQLRQSHRRQAERPFEFKGIQGKVVVFGGHPRMQRNVARRLPDVNLVWFNQDESVTSMTERADVVRDADLVILVTAYTSHKVQKIAQASCEAYGVPLTYQNSTGIRSMLELIAMQLKKHKLTDKYIQNGTN